MDILGLGGFFEVTQYQLCDPSAMLELVNGNIVVRAQYRFRNAAGQQRGAVILLEMVVTQGQSDDLKAILAQVLQATNAEIELRTGWTKWVEPEGV